MADKVLDQLKELDSKRAALFNQAKNDALDAAKKALADLKALGLNYSLVEDSGAEKKATRKGTRTLKDVPCPICTFKTDPPHDARRHKIQKKKRPYNPKELEEMGYQKV